MCVISCACEVKDKECGANVERTSSCGSPDVLGCSAECFAACGSTRRASDVWLTGGAAVSAVTFCGKLAAD